MVAIIKVIEIPDPPKKIRVRKPKKAKKTSIPEGYFSPLRAFQPVFLLTHSGRWLVVRDSHKTADHAVEVMRNGQVITVQRSAVITKGTAKMRISPKSNGTSLAVQAFQNNLQIIR